MTTPKSTIETKERLLPDLEPERHVVVVVETPADAEQPTAETTKLMVTEGENGYSSSSGSKSTISASTPIPEAVAEKTDSAELTTYEGHTSSGLSIPIVDSDSSWLGPCIAILLQLATMAMIIGAIRVQIWFRRYSMPGIAWTLSREDRLIYTTIITLFASLTTAFTVGQIRKLWLRKILVSKGQHDVTLQTRSKASVLVGLGDLIDQIKRWNITAALIIAALCTASIASALSMASYTYSTPYSSIISVDHTFGPLGDNCLIIDDNSTISTGFKWQLSNGSYIYLNITESNFCAQQVVFETLPTPSRRDASNSAYLYGGASISFSAIGVPLAQAVTLFPSFGTTNDSSYTQWNSSENCLPVVSKNPVQCQSAGADAVTVVPNEVNVTIGDCSISTPIYSVDPETEGASAAGACTNNLPVGKATVVFGSVNQHAQWLAAMMNDTSFSSENGSYSVSCSIDIAPSISFRSLEVSLGQNSSGFIISATESPSCTPVGTYFTGDDLLQQTDVQLNTSQFLSDTALAVGASASLNLLNENWFADGWYQTLFDSAKSGLLYNNTQWLNSGNQLEEALGIASAIALGVFWGNPFAQLSNLAGVYIDNGAQNFTGTKLGPGTWWGIIYIGPSLFSTILITYLLYVTRPEPPRWNNIRRGFCL